MWDFFLLFCLKLELFAKIKKTLGSTHSQKPGLSITQDLNKIKKSQAPFFNICETKMCAKYRQKILNSTTVEARQSSKFLRQITWFLINKWALSKFKYLILHHLISYFQITKQLVCKTQFYVNHASHHNYFLLSKISISGEQCFF